MERGNDWTARIAASVGERVAYFREHVKDDRGRKLTVQALSDRCDKLGLPLGRPTISKLEKGMRQTVTVDEVYVLAAALGVAPIELLFAPGHEQKAEVLAGQYLDSWDAIRWFTGEVELTASSGHLSASPAKNGLGLFRAHSQFVEEWQLAPQRLGLSALPRPAGLGDDPTAKVLRDTRRSIEGAIRQTRARMRERGLTPPPLPADMGHIEQQAAADG